MSQESEYHFPQKIKILVAEDNELSKLLVTSVLSNWGVVWTVAENGNKAVEMVRENDFDLILMDIQMPEKDGLEATAEIRNFSDERKKKIPIIALTSNNTLGEQQRCYAAGMNGFLNKPFKEKDLFEMVDQTLHGHPINTSDHTISSSAKKTKSYNLSLIEELMSNNQESVKKIVETFVDSIPPTLLAMQKACAEKDWVETAKQAHSLKSNIDTLQMDIIHNDIKTIEINGKQSIDLEAIPALVSKVTAVIEEAVAQLKLDYHL
jgi:hypothetical protein